MMALINCIRQKLGRVPGLYSLILYGSFVRGDYLPGTSDIDFFVVLEDGAKPEEVLSKLRLSFLRSALKASKPLRLTSLGSGSRTSATRSTSAIPTSS